VDLTETGRVTVFFYVRRLCLYSPFVSYLTADTFITFTFDDSVCTRLLFLILLLILLLVTKLRAGRSGVRIPVETRDSSLLQYVQTGSGGPPFLLFYRHYGSFFVVKAARTLG
jgi:hypothetical protein